MIITEKRFEQDIESFLISAEGGYTKTEDTYDTDAGLYITVSTSTDSKPIIRLY